MDVKDSHPDDIDNLYHDSDLWLLNCHTLVFDRSHHIDNYHNIATYIAAGEYIGCSHSFVVIFDCNSHQNNHPNNIAANAVGDSKGQTRTISANFTTYQTTYSSLFHHCLSY